MSVIAGLLSTLVGSTPSSVPGTQDYTTAGSYSFTVPIFTTLTIQMWGGGGGGAHGELTGSNIGGYNPTSGGATSISSLGLTANGGERGYGWGLVEVQSGRGGNGGTASGGTTNTTGGAGVAGLAWNGTARSGGKGGDASNGGAGGAGGYDASNFRGDGVGGSAPGGGGGGGSTSYADGALYDSGGGGGAGGYCTKTYNAGELTVGDSLSITVGAGGNGAATNGYGGAGGSGAAGRVYISWT